jgi:hypothetical protein
MSGLLNYTTTVAVDKTIGEVYAMLARGKAQAIMSEYDGFGNVSAISFKVYTPFGLMAFRLPANVKAAADVINAQARARQIPRKFMNDVPQARRVAWRIVRQWIEAQLALVTLGMAKIEEVFLPYAQDASGRTVFETLQEKQFSGLALPAPGEQKP